MTTRDNQPIGPDGFAVTIEMGEDFTPGPRTAAALAQLVEALEHEYGPEPEVEAFEFVPTDPVRNLAFAMGDGSVRFNGFLSGWPSKVTGPQP